MSFILDALKKVEREKRGRDTTGASMVAFSMGERGGGRQYLTMGAIALVSAGVTAAIFFGVSRGKADVPRPEASGSVAERPASRPDAGPAVLVPEPNADAHRREPTADAHRREPAVVEEPTPSQTPPPSASAVMTASSPAGSSPLVASPSADVDDADDEPAVELVPEEPTHPINIVGRERAAQFAVERDVRETQNDVVQEARLEPELDSSVPIAEAAAGDRVESTPSEPSGHGVETPLRELPTLVLQGTSVLDGNAVAVISEKRVFEGDWIDGARVVAIREREVELEFEGRVFTLRL